MGRLIEVQDVGGCPSPLTIHPGDVLLFRAAGGRVHSGNDVVEELGAFLTAVIGDNGSVLTPEGPPNAVLFRAHRSGDARIEIISGAAFHAPQRRALDVRVAPRG
jgi:hypothetical protein